MKSSDRSGKMSGKNGCVMTTTMMTSIWDFKMKLRITMNNWQNCTIWDISCGKHGHIFTKEQRYGLNLTIIPLHW